MWGVVCRARSPSGRVDTRTEGGALPMPGIAQSLGRLLPLAGCQPVALPGPADFQGTAQTRQPVVGSLALVGYAHLAAWNQTSESEGCQSHGRPLDDGLGLFGEPNPSCRYGRLLSPGDTQEKARVAFQVRRTEAATFHAKLAGGSRLAAHQCNGHQRAVL